MGQACNKNEESLAATVTCDSAHTTYKENIVVLVCDLEGDQIPFFFFLRKARNPDFSMLNVLILSNAVS